MTFISNTNAHRSWRSRVGVAAVLALTLVSGAAWARGGAGGGGGHGGGMGGMEAGHLADRGLAESRGREPLDGRTLPRLDHDHDHEAARYLDSPYFGDDYFGGYGYGGYCDVYSPAYNPAYCDY